VFVPVVCCCCLFSLLCLLFGLVVCSDVLAICCQRVLAEIARHRRDSVCVCSSSSAACMPSSRLKFHMPCQRGMPKATARVSGLGALLEVKLRASKDSAEAFMLLCGILPEHSSDICWSVIVSETVRSSSNNKK